MSLRSKTPTPPANRRSGSAGCLVIPALLATRSPTRWPTLAVVQPAHCHLLLPRMAPASSTTSTPTPPLPNPYQPRSPTWTGLTCMQISTQLTLPTTPGSAHFGSHLVYPSLLIFPFYLRNANQLKEFVQKTKKKKNAGVQSRV